MANNNPYFEGQDCWDSLRLLCRVRILYLVFIYLKYLKLAVTQHFFKSQMIPSLNFLKLAPIYIIKNKKWDLFQNFSANSINSWWYTWVQKL